jgi:hypothetical protein
MFQGFNANVNAGANLNIKWGSLACRLNKKLTFICALLCQNTSLPKTLENLHHEKISRLCPAH